MGDCANDIAIPQVSPPFRGFPMRQEKLLMALQLPKGRQVLFAAAPDALDPELAECLAPLETEANFVGAGYEEGINGLT